LLTTLQRSIRLTGVPLTGTLRTLLSGPLRKSIRRFDVVVGRSLASVAADQMGEHVASLADSGQAIADALDELLTRSWG
jgi:hypothetical protein